MHIRFGFLPSSKIVNPQLILELSSSSPDKYRGCNLEARSVPIVIGM